jgi:hypothetical protein
MPNLPNCAGFGCIRSDDFSETMTATSRINNWRKKKQERNVSSRYYTTRAIKKLHLNECTRVSRPFPCLYKLLTSNAQTFRFPARLDTTVFLCTNAFPSVVTASRKQGVKDDDPQKPKPKETRARDDTERLRIIISGGLDSFREAVTTAPAAGPYSPGEERKRTRRL